MTITEKLALARSLADDSGPGRRERPNAVAEAAGILYRLANGPDLDYPGHMRWNETRGACERASSPSELRRLFALPSNASVQGGTMVIAAEPGFAVFLRAACESCEWDGADLVLADLTGARPWRIRLQGAR